MMFFEEKKSSSVGVTNSCAFSFDDIVEFQVVIPRKLGTTSAHMHLFGEGISNKYYSKIQLNWVEIRGDKDVYSISLDLSQIEIGLYYYYYEINGNKTVFLGDGVGFGELREVQPNESSIQLLIYNETSNCAKWLRGGVMYQIFVDRFFKTGKTKPKKNVILNDDWYNGIPQYAEMPGGYVENNMFFGGDLYGVIEKLDYIKSLGVNCIYLCPVFDAYSNHKYDTGNYMEIDSMFGGEKAFDMLISEAKKRDIHIILDGVFNHTGSDSVYFNKNGNYKTVGAYQSKESPYYSWYNFRNYPDDYECWWNVKILPRVKSDEPEYVNYILGDGGVIEKWMKKGVDGFRLDVADELSDNFLRTLNKKLKSINPSGVVYGEVWEDASNKIAYDKRKEYFLGNELDSVMNYPLRTSIIDYVKNGNFEGLFQTFKMLYTHYPKHNMHLLMNLLGTHDTERILTVLGGEDGNAYTNEQLSTKKMSKEQKKLAKTRLMLCYGILATVPGVPCIYYGDEVGMEGYRDPFNRLPYPWGKEDLEILDFYKRIGKIRSEEPIYRDGEFKVLRLDEDLLVFVRFISNEMVITVANRSNKKFYIDSNVNLFNIETNRPIKTVKPFSLLILKCKSSIYEIDIGFTE